MKFRGYCSSENVKYLDFFPQLYFYCELSNRTALMVAVLPYNLHQKKVHSKTLCDIFCFEVYMTSLPMCGFIAQLVEHRAGIAEVTGSNPVEALIFFQASSFQLLKLENLLR